jgi:hypothetical protein
LERTKKGILFRFLFYNLLVLRAQSSVFSLIPFLSCSTRAQHQSFTPYCIHYSGNTSSPNYSLLWKYKCKRIPCFYKALV